MRNFESELMENIVTDQLYERAAADLRREEIKIEQFVDLYGADNVARDQAYVRKMEEQFAAGADPEQARFQKLATIFEGVFHNHAEISNWLGENAFTIRPSRFDDIRNGVDSIVEFRETETAASYLGLAIDVTTAENLSGKFDRIKKEIENGELGRIKYFVSEHTGVRGELSNLPKVVIGADRQTVKALGEMHAEKNNQALGSHFIQFQVLEEISLQLKAFEEYARRVGRSDLADVYRKTCETIKKISIEKRKVLKDGGERDAVFAAIEAQLANFKK